jgi:hypothetical protein
VERRARELQRAQTGAEHAAAAAEAAAAAAVSNQQMSTFPPLNPHQIGGIRACAERRAVDSKNRDLINLRMMYCTGQAIPTNKKKILSTGPETRRKRSVCSKASK